MVSNPKPIHGFLTIKSFLVGNIRYLFFDILDGKLIGLLPALPGWIYFNLYGQCKSARSVFITVEDVLADWAEQDGADSEVLTANYRSASASIDAFLEKLLPGQVNYEGNMGFRWEEDKIVASLMNLLQSASNNENLDAGDAVKSSHLGQKWSNYPNKDRLILALESFLPYLPNSISSMLLQKLEMTPTAISKQLKPNETIVKAISAKPNFELPDHLAPTSDYSITEKKSKSDKKPAAPQDKNQKSINSFFLKAQK